MAAVDIVDSGFGRALLKARERSEANGFSLSRETQSRCLNDRFIWKRAQVTSCFVLIAEWHLYTEIVTRLCFFFQNHLQPNFTNGFEHSGMQCLLE